MATQVKTSLPDELVAKIIKQAKKEGRSVSSLLAFMIETKWSEMEASELNQK